LFQALQCQPRGNAPHFGDLDQRGAHHERCNANRPDRQLIVIWL
jgi:hypothetical protein